MKLKICHENSYSILFYSIQHYDSVSAILNSYLQILTVDFLSPLSYNNFVKQIKIFKLENGKRPINIWLYSLDKHFRYRILDRFDKLEEGYYGDFKAIDSEIKELRFKFGSGYRIYFHETNDTIIVLLCGGNKSTQSKDIKKAKEYLKMWKEQKNG